jgi:RNA polymerase sigma-70 factor (ECF subfamily)
VTDGAHANPPARSGAGDRRDDDVLVASLRAGGRARQAAVGRLFDRYALEFKRYFRRHGLSHEQTEDLAQESFLKIVQSADTFDGTGSLEAWIWTIARNTLMSELRARRADVSLDGLQVQQAEALVASIGQAGSNPAAADCVERAFAAFSMHYRDFAEVLVRVVVDGWEYADLAQYRSCTYGAAREYLSQCRKRLADFVAPCFEMAEGR